VQWRSWQTPSGDHIDQITRAGAVKRIRTRDRRNIVSAWNVGEDPANGVASMSPRSSSSTSRRAESCQLYRRSADLFLGVPFNIAAYALLTHMMAAAAVSERREFVWTGRRLPFYDNHVDRSPRRLSAEPAAYPESLWRAGSVIRSRLHLEEPRRRL